jgi:UPF0716 protein FxsA
MPTDSLVDGIMILVASALLVTPGVITDLVGFLCLIPGFRVLVKAEVVRRFQRAVAENRIHVHQSGPGPGPIQFENEPPFSGPIVDVTPPASAERDPVSDPGSGKDGSRGA